MKVYLAGPMRGYDLYNFPAFDHATAALRARGWEVVSPAEMDRDIGFDEHTVDRLPDGFVEDAMRRDVQAILGCDGVALLPGWEQSTGATFERQVCEQIGGGVFLLEWVDAGAGVYFTRPDNDQAARLLEAEDLTDAIRPVESTREARMRRSFPDADARQRAIGRHPSASLVEQQEHALEQIRAEFGGPAGETRVRSATGGEKGSKLARFDMIPPDILWELAEHYGAGERKYPSDPVTHEANWQKGYAWSLSVAALQRHLSQWLQGEDFDDETWSSHLIAVVWHAMALRWWQLHGRGTDDVRQQRAA